MIKSASIIFLFVVFALSVWSQISEAQMRGSGSGGGSRSAVFVTSKSGVLLDFAIHYGQAEAVGNPTTQDFKNNTSVYDTKLGYISDNNWYLGALYSVKNYSTLAGATNGKVGGVGFGYFFRNNFNFRAYYRHNEAFGEYRKGTGFQADLEYKVSFASNFYIGALVSHRQMTYKENESITSFEDYTAKETFPAITLGFLIN